jgi:catechol 2,3-dioxygenase-like lactoylglutathione lyase family enzyme
MSTPATPTSQLIFTRVIPDLAVNDIDRSLAFYGQLGFQTVYQDPGFAIVKRDAVALHLNRCPVKATENESACRIIVTSIETLYQQCLPMNAIHPNGPLTTKPYGFKEFALVDPSGVLITFAEPVS